VRDRYGQFVWQIVAKMSIKARAIGEQLGLRYDRAAATAMQQTIRTQNMIVVIALRRPFARDVDSRCIHI
jgi:hypothetical protein